MEYVDTNLNKSSVGFHEKIWELIGWVGPVKEGVDIVVLNEITTPSTQKVDSAREYIMSSSFSYQPYNFCLVFLVVFYLLGQWNRTLHNTKKFEHVIFVIK